MRPEQPCGANSRSYLEAPQTSRSANHVPFLESHLAYNLRITNKVLPATDVILIDTTPTFKLRVLSGEINRPTDFAELRSCVNSLTYVGSIKLSNAKSRAIQCLIDEKP